MSLRSLVRTGRTAALPISPTMQLVRAGTNRHTVASPFPSMRPGEVA